jgi:hypothetical protein
MILCIVLNLLQQNQLDVLISEIYSWNETLHVSDSSSVHHQECFTVHTSMAYVRKPVWLISLLCVQWKTLDDGQRNCPIHVEFHSKNKIEKLVHLVCFIIRKLKVILQPLPTNVETINIIRKLQVLLQPLPTNVETINAVFHFVFNLIYKTHYICVFVVQYFH